jgi:hypothetical protein
MRVLRPLVHNGRSYAPGESIDLTPEQAAAMPWAVDPEDGSGAAAAGEAQSEAEALVTIAAIADVDALIEAEAAEQAREDGGRPAVLTALDERFDALASANAGERREASAENGE